MPSIDQFRGDRESAQLVVAKSPITLTIPAPLRPDPRPRATRHPAPAASTPTPEPDRLVAVADIATRNGAVNAKRGQFWRAL